MRALSLTLCVLISGCAASASNLSANSAYAVLPTAPNDSKGGSTQALGAIDLGPEVKLPAYQLRVRSVTIQPGGYLAAHTHQGRPTMEYVAQGTVIEIRNGQPFEHKAGEMVRASHGVTHWWENHGSVPVVLVPVDVFKP